jgi:16S rRNA (cytosine1402-N4)-methyltransferase
MDKHPAEIERVLPDPVDEKPFHIPVMLNEILSLFRMVSRPDPFVIDCTLGSGGHAQAILSSSPGCSYMGIDADPEAVERAASRLESFSGRLRIYTGFFDEVLAEYLSDPGCRKADFILFDLGVSMHHFKDSGRGFSFTHDEPLDMRFSPSLDESAYDVVNGRREEELADIIFKYGEERYSRRIAKAICAARSRSPVRTSAALAEVIARSVSPSYRHGRIHPATRTFQALRIWVNSELEREEKALNSAARLLSPGGILAVISFHSLEDRIAKHFCKHHAKIEGFEDIFKKPLQPGDEECAENAASRSAKLRALRAPAALGLLTDPSNGRSI